MTKKLVTLGILAALTFPLSYIEFLFPLSFIPVPGFKLGLANIAVMAALMLYDTKSAAAVSGIRLIFSLLFFSNPVSFLFSLSGAFLSLTVMAILKKTDFFTPVGISVAGAAFHNIGQLVAASVIFSSPYFFSYLPVLTLAGTATGVLNGFVIVIILKVIRKRA